MLLLEISNPALILINPVNSGRFFIMSILSIHVSLGLAPFFKNSNSATRRKPLKRGATVVKKDIFSVHVQ